MTLPSNLSNVIALPAPVGGLNLKSGLANMAPTEAYILDNLLPKETSVELRGGYRTWATGMGSGMVETVAVFAAGATQKLIGCANGNIYNASTLDAAATSLGSGFAEDYWNTINYGAFLLFFNGVDTPQKYDGTTLSNAVYTGGVTPENLIQPNVYRNRLYIVEKNSLSVWYSHVNTPTGSLTEFAMDDVFRKGGALQFSVTWTRDSGTGMDDLFVAVSNQGEAVIYQGSYPGGTDWTLIGRFDVPEVLGRKAFCQLGGDVVLLTTNGVFPLSAVTQYGNSVQSTRQISDNINPAFIDLSRVYGDNTGWQAIVYPRGYYIMLSVPISATQAIQYVCNLQTGKWCRYTGYNGNAWVVYDANLYYGGDGGKIYQAEYGTLDGAGGVSFSAAQAFNLFGTNNNKLFSMIRPMLTITGAMEFNMTVNVDFALFSLLNYIISVSGNSSPWNTSPWNTTPWTTSTTTQDWYNVGTFGRYGSVLLSGNTDSTGIKWHNTDILIEPSESII